MSNYNRSYKKDKKEARREKRERLREERPTLKEARSTLSAENKGAIKVAVIKRMAKYIFEHKAHLAICFAIMLTSNLLALAAPKLSQSAIDAIEPGVGKVDMQKVLFFAALMLLFYVVSASLSYLLSILMVKCVPISKSKNKFFTVWVFAVVFIRNFYNFSEDIKYIFFSI